MRSSQTVEVAGHLMDSGILSRILDDIRDHGGDYVIDRFDVGHEAHDPSRARITVQADDEAALQRLLMRLQSRGVNQLDPGEVALATADLDGVLPDGFYATTDLDTRVRHGGAWYDVENPERDCGLVLLESPDHPLRVRTVPMSDVRAGMRIVVGATGVRVTVPEPGTGDTSPDDPFGEKPQAVVVRQVADGMRQARAQGQRLLWVAGPGVVHTGAVPALTALVGAGFVDTLFAGNALATHDVASALDGAGPGTGLTRSQVDEPGHERHVRAVNTVRRAGSIARAVADGTLSSGVMHALVTHRKRFVLVGSVRDEGPLPDVVTDVVEGKRAMREEIVGVGYCLMVASHLHAEATSKILPASVPVVCVDVDPATVTRITDRGSGQGRGVVTDVGLFLEQLALELVPDYRRS